MSFKRFHSQYGKMKPGLEELGLAKALYFQCEGDFLNLVWSNRGLSRDANLMLNTARTGASRAFEIFLLSQVFAFGPKVFEVESLDLEALINTDLNIEMQDYDQPFDTVVMQLPDDFCKNNIVSPQIDPNDASLPKTTEPDFLVIHHDKELHTIIFALFYKEDISIKVGFALKPGTIIDNALRENLGREFADSLGIGDQEKILLEDLIRAAMNYCLLVGEVGHKKIEAINKDYERKLTKKAAEGDQKAIKELRQRPVYHTLEQKVQLYQVKYQHDRSQTTGQTVRPHHRRGHYRFQRFGSGLVDRKRIRIAPIFVNADLFLGKKSNTSVIYKGKVK